MPRKRGAPPPFRGNSRRGGSYNQSPRPQIHLTTSFSLADEARQTGKSDHSSWDRGSKLRSKPVTFVSAGTSAPLELLEEALLNPETEEFDPAAGKSPYSEDGPVLPNDQDTAEPTGDFPDDVRVPLQAQAVVARPVNQGDNDQDSDEVILGPEDLEQHIEEERLPENRRPSFFFDLKGDPTPDAGSKSPVIPDRPDPVDSESSDEEIILFKGRDRAPGSARDTITMSQIRTEIQVVEKELEAAPSKRSNNRRGGKGRNRRRVEEDDDAEMYADYIANMRETGELSDFLKLDQRNRRDLGGALSDDAADEEDAAEVETGKSDQQDGERDQFVSESELDDETLAKLIAGQDPSTLDPNADIVDITSDSDSSDAILTRAQDITAYEQLDFMDWGPPNPRKKKKGKAARAHINFGLSDSEMEQQLQAAFNNDRLKKAQRKKQREELRTLGQLGKNARGPEDMMTKYPGGMTMDQVADEIRSFMQAQRETMTLPPMDPNARKIIHEIANKFNIKSKSTGNGDQRRPTLYRTGRTLPYNEAAFDAVINRIRRRYLPRPDVKHKRTAPKIKVRGGNDAAVKVRNGEVVGAAAPELGSSNRGRMMLEKMGWSSGTALGSENNKGILQPVAQTMKTNKAGLG